MCHASCVWVEYFSGAVHKRFRAMGRIERSKLITPMRGVFKNAMGRVCFDCVKHVLYGVAFDTSVQLLLTRNLIEHSADWSEVQFLFARRV